MDKKEIQKLFHAERIVNNFPVRRINVYKITTTIRKLPVCYDVHIPVKEEFVFDCWCTYMLRIMYND